MATGSIAEEFTMAVPADLLWKETFSHDATTLKKTFAGLVDDVEINGDGGPGSLVTMKFNPGIHSTQTYFAGVSPMVTLINFFSPAFRSQPWVRRWCSRAVWWRKTMRRAWSAGTGWWWRAARWR
jgi:hypothetical protein